MTLGEALSDRASGSFHCLLADLTLVTSAQPRVVLCAAGRAKGRVQAALPAGLGDTELAGVASTLTPASWLGSTLSGSVLAAGQGQHPDVFSSSPAWTAGLDLPPELHR